MGHFNLTRPEGTWVTGGALYAAELADIDRKTSKAINGDDGGVWAPSSDLEIGGSHTFRLTCAFQTTSTTALGAGATVTGGDLLVSQDAHVQGNLTCANLTASGALTAGATTCASLVVSGGVTVQGTCDLQSNVGVGGALTVAGTSALHGAVHCYATLTVDGAVQAGGPCTLAGGVAINGPSTLTQPMTASGQGAFLSRMRVLTTDAGLTVSANDTTDLYLPPGLWSGIHGILVASTGASTGAFMTIRNADTSHDMVVSSVDTGIAIVTVHSGECAEIKFVNGGWVAWRKSGSV